MIKLEEDKYWMLYSNCIPVKGARRSLICDLQLMKFIFIPNGLFDILTIHKTKTIKQIKKFYDEQEDHIISEYFQMLIDNNLIYFVASKAQLKNFISLSLKWDYWSKISNAIIDFNDKSSHSLNEIVNQLIELQCYFVQVRHYNSLSYSALEKCIEVFERTPIRSVEIISRYEEGLNIELLKDICLKFPRLKYIGIHSAPVNDFYQPTDSGMGMIYFTTKIINSSSHCGMISKEYFSSNLGLFTESQAHNSCLNRKISIDENGEIKNCPSMARSYGNTQDTSLLEALNAQGFKENWLITKDQITTCKDCEFRYVCTDCRAYIEDPSFIYSKPLKCGYNPYTSEWEEWSKSPLKQEAIQYYGLK